MKRRQIAIVLAFLLLLIGSSLAAPLAGDKTAEDESNTTLRSFDGFSFDYVWGMFDIIPLKEQNGFYYFNDAHLCFYELGSGESQKIKDVSNASSFFVQGDDLYLLCGSYVQRYSLKSQTEERIELSTSGSAVGADALGNIYISGRRSSGYYVAVYDKAGKELASTDIDYNIYRFSGFDPTNGNFYFERYYNWIYWGYDHDTNAAGCGNFKNGILTVSDSYIQGSKVSSLSEALLGSCNLVLFQRYYTDHNTSLKLIEDKYLVASSILYGKLFVLDSNSYVMDSQIVDYYYEQSRGSNEGGSYSSTSSVGVNAAYNPVHDSMIIYQNNCVLEEYSMSDMSLIGSVNSSYYVFDMAMVGDRLVLIEKDEEGNFYVETMLWKDPTKLILSGDAAIEVGGSGVLEVSNDSAISGAYEWSSSDPAVVSVDNAGRLAGWKSGSAVITAKDTNYGISAQVIVTVSQGSKAGSVDSFVNKLSGDTTSNRSYNNYSVYAQPVSSYLYTDADGSYTRVQYTGNKVLLVERYDKSFKKLSANKLSLPLSLFGGFYHGTDANYVIVGQKNEKESDETEVLRVIKYDLNWNYVGKSSVYGANTYIPFDAGSCRMTELEGRLYIHTCHEMYASSDGLHHQANMIFVMDEKELDIVDSYYDVMNTSYGYVSHSFNQFIQTDGYFIFRVDHGDANPRSIFLSTFAKDNQTTQLAAYGSLMYIGGNYGANYTGVSIGGFELSGSNPLIVGNSIDQETYAAYGQKNVFVISVDMENTGRSSQKWLTEYKEGANTDVGTPVLVKLDEEHFAVLWEESTSAGTVTKLCGIDRTGNLCTDVISTSFRLSDCQPIGKDDGTIEWYVADGSTVVLNRINIYDTPASSLTLTASRSEIKENETADVSFKISPENGKYGTITFSSSNTAVATVDAKGHVTPLKPGKVTITARSSVFTDVHGSVTINIVAKDVPVSSLKVNPSSITMMTLADYKLTANIAPATATNKSLKWTSSDPAVATVDANGVVHALTYGTATITAVTQDGSSLKSSCVVNTLYYDVAGSNKKGASNYQYYFDAVYWAAKKGITKGFDNVYFGPEQYCTREQMVVFLWRLAGKPAPVTTECAFSDVEKGTYYYNAVLWAAEKGITKGYSSGENAGKFGVGFDVTREDAITFLYRLAGKPKVTGSSKSFSDVGKNAYYYAPVMWAAGQGVTNGYSSGEKAGSFGVGEQCLREQIVTFMYRYNNLKK